MRRDDGDGSIRCGLERSDSGRKRMHLLVFRRNNAFIHINYQLYIGNWTGVKAIARSEIPLLEVSDMEIY